MLIVGTVPYNPKSTSRAFESYFNNWDSKNLAQVFSNTKTPIKDHSDILFQITNQRLLKKRFNESLDTGVIYNDEELSNECSNNSIEINSSLFSKLYTFGSRKSPFIYLFRKRLWSKKYWLTKKLEKWLDQFKPE